MKKSHAQKLRNMIVKGSVSLPDEDAMDVIELYDEWQTNTAYQTGDRCRYDGVLYKCVQAHTSQSDWTPDAVPALWARVSVDEWAEWVQPTGAQDAYNKGDKVSHNGKHWMSEIDGNVWEPGTADNLWSEVL